MGIDCAFFSSILASLAQVLPNTGFAYQMLPTTMLDAAASKTAR